MGSLPGSLLGKVFLSDERNAREETAHPAFAVVEREENSSSCSSNIVTTWEPARGRKPTGSGMQGRKMKSNKFFDDLGTILLETCNKETMYLCCLCH